MGNRKNSFSSIDTFTRFPVVYRSPPTINSATLQTIKLSHIARLYQQALALQQQASQHQITLSLAEELNGIDLANQASLAALDQGYIDWLAMARQQSMGEKD